MRLLSAVALLLSCLAMGQPAGPPHNDNIAQAEWVRTLIRMRVDSSIVEAAAGQYPGGDLATQYLRTDRAYEFVNFTANGTNIRATMELDEPSHGTHSGGISDALYRETGASVWWKWTAPINATMRLTTIGSTFDTTLAVYTLVPWDGITLTNEFGVKVVGQGDDIWWNKQLQSEADFVAHAGETYYIAVGGFRGAEGLISLAGRVESWIYPPVIIARVALPRFELDLFGLPQDSLQRQHSKFVNVTITCETPGAEIFYTTDGLMPNVLQTITQGYRAMETTRRFTTPLPMDTVTLRAVAYKPGLRRSLLATSTPFQLQATAPVFEPDGGEFEVEQAVRIFPTTDEDSDPRAVIHYTLDGSEPELTSPRFAGSVVLRNVSNITMKARVWYPSEWREDGDLPGSTTMVKGMLPSNVSISKLFTVKERLPLPSMPTIYGEEDPMVLKGGNPPLEPKSFIGAANIHLYIDDPLAELWYAFAKSLAMVESWTRYTGNFSVTEVGVHWIHVQGRRRFYTHSFPVTDRFEVLQRISVVQPNVPFLHSVQPGRYVYFTLNLTTVGTDVTVSVDKFFGSVDLFLSARQRRPSLRNHSLSATSREQEGGVGGSRLLAMHIDKHLGIEVIAERNSTCPLCPYSTPIVVGIFGRGVTATQMLVNIRLDTSPVIRLSHLYHGVVAIGKWTYFKFYLGNAPEPTRRGLVVRVWQQPAAFVGLRTALRQTNKPTSDLSNTAYTMFGDANGYFEFTVPVSTTSREPWFVGVQGLVPVFGVEAFNFTFAVSPMLENDVPYPGRSLTMGERRPAEDALQPTARSIDFQDILEGVSVQGSVRVGRFAFFRIRILRSLRWLEVRVTEEHYSGGLRIYAQQGVAPSLISHLTQNVSTASNVGQGREGYFYTAPAYEGKDYYIGVYGFSYDFQSDMRIPEYRFTLTATTSPRISGMYARKSLIYRP
ncbi:chitobiase/beta-hexosaminidase C-terminal domain-containing protein [bacterium]|nr:chitobiase/beta-hexosaminidase C-terminal domain-containing protein [bacterium]